MISGILLRHYKNYGNLKFIPICDSTEYMYSVYVGNNGVGKSAIGFGCSAERQILECNYRYEKE